MNLDSTVLYISILVAITLLAVTLTIFLLIIKRNKETLRMNYEVNKIEMERMREYFESQIYNLNEKMLSNYSRFKDANHLLFNERDYQFPINYQPRLLNPEAFLERHGLYLDDIKIKNRDIFVLIPFLEESKPIFNTIKKLCNSEDFNCSMGKDEYIDSDIFPYILKKILEARMIIASIDGRNANVFYELGIAHALGKPTILISKDTYNNKVPVDLQSKFIIYYKDLRDLESKIVDRILKVLIDEN